MVKPKKAANKRKGKLKHQIKAMAKVNKASLCKLGYCVKKGSRYQGGNEAVFNKLRNGICPICGGATEQKY